MTATVLRAGGQVGQATEDPSLDRDRGRRLLWSARMTLAVSLALWVVALPSMPHARVSQYGLLFAANPLFILATLGVTLGFVLAARVRSVPDCVAAVLGLVAVTRATASIVEPLPIYTWTYKHVGVIDHLSATGQLARNVDIYNNWPGFFSAAAWFSDVTGVSFLDVARWFPVVADIAICTAMYAVSRAFGQTVHTALVAACAMQIFNWVAQDYYSPQATAFVLALTAIALLLRSRAHPRSAWFAVPIFVAITITHQLTPFWLCGIAVLLALTRQVRPRVIAVVLIAVALAFTAANFSALSPYGLLTGFDPLSNAQSNVPTAGNAGRSFTSLAAKGTSALMWLSAIACGVVARRRGERVWVPVVLGFTSFALLAGQSYGGEAIFRVFLYSIPGCLLLIAPVAERAITRRPRRHGWPAALGRLVVVGATVLAVLGSMQAYYGTWFINVVDRDGLVTETQLLDTAPTDSLIVPVVVGVAERPTGRYVDFARNDHGYDLPLIEQPGVQQSSLSASQVRSLTATYLDTGRPVYIVVTEQMRRYADYYGLFPQGAIDRLVRELRASDRWTTLRNTPTLSVFRLDRS